MYIDSTSTYLLAIDLFKDIILAVFFDGRWRGGRGRDQMLEAIRRFALSAFDQAHTRLSLPGFWALKEKIKMFIFLPET